MGDPGTSVDRWVAVDNQWVAPRSRGSLSTHMISTIHYLKDVHCNHVADRVNHRAPGGVEANGCIHTGWGEVAVGDRTGQGSHRKIAGGDSLDCN